MNMIKQRAFALTLATALFAVAFLGMFAVQADDIMPDPLVATVYDDFGDAEDGNTYDSGWFEFNLTGWDQGTVDYYMDYTVELYLNEDFGSAMVMTRSPDVDAWVYLLNNPPAGEHSWKIKVMNNTDSMVMWAMNDTDDPLMVRDVPMFTSGADFSIDEDATYMWNLTEMDYFDPEDLTYAFDIIMGDEYIGITDASYGMYTVWEVEAIMEDAYDVYAHVNLTATDAWGESDYNVFNISVDMVDDAPMLYGIDFMGETIVAEEMNVTTEYDENMTAINWTMVWAIQLDIEEDAMEINFTVNATDVDTEMLTYEFAEGDYYTLTVPNASMPCHFNFTSEMDMFGLWEANLTVSDGTTDVVQMVWFNVMAVNDAPMGSFVSTIPDDMTFMIETGVDLGGRRIIKKKKNKKIISIW